MLEVQSKALQKALHTLNILGCKYAVIDSDGAKYGDLVIAEQKQKTRKPSFFTRGEVRSYILNFISNIQVGETVEIPYGKYGGKTLQSNCASYLHGQYGEGSHCSTQNHAKQALEVLRLN